MGQIKIYGLDEKIDKNRKKISDVIHSSVMDAFKYPENKRFHRFIKLAKEDFIYSNERTENYTIVEISIFEGRTIEAKKRLIKLLFERFKSKIGIENNDLEITIFETAKENWGIRGLPGDELSLNYKVEV